MHLQPAKRVEEVRLIYGDPYLIKKTAEDGYNGEISFTDRDHYLMIIDGDKRIGVWAIKSVSNSVLDVHFSILKGYNRKVKEAGRLLIDWFVNESPEQCMKLNAQIPNIHNEIYKFAKRLGFKDEGINRVSFLKNKKLYDQYRLGITRQEAKQCITGVNNG